MVGIDTFNSHLYAIEATEYNRIEELHYTLAYLSAIVHNLGTRVVASNGVQVQKSDFLTADDFLNQDKKPPNAITDEDAMKLRLMSIVRR